MTADTAAYENQLGTEMYKALAVVLSVACVSAWFRGIFILAAVSCGLCSIILFSIPAYLATMVLAWLLFFCRVLSRKHSLESYIRALIFSLAAPAAIFFIDGALLHGAAFTVLFDHALLEGDSTAVHAALACTILSPLVFILYSLVKRRRFFSPR